MMIHDYSEQNFLEFLTTGCSIATFAPEPMGSKRTGNPEGEITVAMKKIENPR